MHEDNLENYALHSMLWECWQISDALVLCYKTVLDKERVILDSQWKLNAIRSEAVFAYWTVCVP